MYIRARDPAILDDMRRFALLLGLVVLTVALCQMAGDAYYSWRTDWRAESIPLLLFAMTVAIAYHQELSMLLTASLAAAGGRCSAWGSGCRNM